MVESKSATKDPVCGMTVDEANALHKRSLRESWTVFRTFIA